ncbi:YdaU family protein [Pseudomonas capsici]|uniref:YdaU family protein n=1 Tax=Pseudomonas capsici TaxID=2810614 RepID=UPI0021F1115A|nr:YdaU family protein [Pseudomonas capsici]MCV4290870.1 YdaU family protein [Pseudomonas capsici]
MHYYKFNIKDWSRDTAHLSIEEEGIYRRLLDHYYETERPIPQETKPVIRRLRLTGHEEAFGVVLGEFFTLESDGYHHRRCDEEISKYHAKATANRENGSRGGRPRKPAENPNGSQQEPKNNLNQEPLTINQEPEDQEQCAANASPDQSEPDSTKSKRGTRIDKDWSLSPELAAWAKTERPELDDRMIRSMADGFRDFWMAKTGKGATKLDWAATWRNWVRNQRVTVPGQRAGPLRPSPHLNLDHLDHEEGLERQSDGSYRIARTQA